MTPDASGDLERELARLAGAEDAYAVLAVAAKARMPEIKEAHRRLARLLHPDRVSGAGPAAAMAQVNVAYGVLTDPKKRALLDLHRRKDAPPECGKCHGTGKVTRQRGFSTKVLSVCPACHGAGTLL